MPDGIPKENAPMDNGSREAGDTCSGVFVTAFGLILMGMSARLPLGSPVSPGSGAFPLLLSLVLTALGLALTVQQIRAGLSWVAARHILVTYGPPLSIFILLTCAYVFTFELGGFVLNTTFFLTVMLWHFQGVNFIRSVAYSLAISLLAYTLFNYVFQLRLPSGLLHFW